MAGIGEQLASAVVDDDDVELSAFARGTIVGGVGRRGLSGSGTGEQAGENAQRFAVGDDLFESEGRYLEFFGAEGGSHVGIPLVGAYHAFTG